MDSPRIFVSEETLEFHRSCLVVDLHTDCLITGRVLGRNLGRRHRAPRGFMPWRLHADIPKLIEGGVDAVFLGIVTHPWPRRAFERALRAIDYQRYVLEKNRDLVTLEVDPGTTGRLLDMVPDGCVVVSESGIKERGHVIEFEEMRVDALLVGEVLMRSGDPVRKARELLGEVEEPCGSRSAE